MAKARRKALEPARSDHVRSSSASRVDQYSRVTITERNPAAPPHPNWIAVFTMSGPRIVPERALRLINHLQNEFDLG